MNPEVAERLGLLVSSYQSEVTKMLNNVQRIGYIPINGGNGNNSPGVWEWLVTAWNWLTGSGFFAQGTRGRCEIKC
ncbi:MAG: hypothetical protein GH144_02655 [Clostridia bacterium]|jgi:hypothetical protein|nr:hypothetical protein [Clostridia bacterium]